MVGRARGPRWVILLASPLTLQEISIFFYSLWSPGIGYGGDGGPLLLAGIGPQSIAFTATGYYVNDILNNRIRLVTPAWYGVCLIGGPEAIGGVRIK
jgi:hypothetical protein